MSDAVIMLGAGASADAGAPLMADFLDRADDLLSRGEVGQHRDQFVVVRQARRALEGANARGSVDTKNLESVFAAFEMIELFGGTKGIGLPSEGLVSSLKTVIVETLSRLIQSPSRKGKPSAPKAYFELMTMLQRLEFERVKKNITFITFNYDLCLDYMFYLLGWPVDYRLGASHGGVGLLKLHGSLNWAVCPGCKDLYWLDVGRHFGDVRRATASGVGLFSSFPDAVLEQSHCGRWHPSEPYIVPPTWNKGGYSEPLQSVWIAAVEELSTAANILVAGYSLPESDHFFRLLYSLDTHEGNILRNIWVHDPSKAPKSRFEAMLGPVARERFQFFEGYDFAGAVSKWADLLGSSPPR